MQQPWLVTSLAQAHVVCGIGSGGEGLSRRVAVCPLQLTEKAVQVCWASLIQKPLWLNLGYVDGTSALLVQMPMHISPGDVFCPFHCPGNCEWGGSF